MIKMKGLGRGLDALLSGNDKKSADEQRQLPVERLKPGKYQPRTQMDADSLAAAVAAVGSVLLLLNWPAQNVAAFIGIIVLFMGAFVAMAGVMAALKHHRIGLVVQCLLLMMWSVLLPLVLQNTFWKSGCNPHRRAGFCHAFYGRDGPRRKVGRAALPAF